METINDVRVFAQGSGMNLDVDIRALLPNEYRQAWNIIVGSSAGGKLGCASNLKGTTSIFDLPVNSGFNMPQGDFKGVGACADKQRNAIVILVKDKSVNKNHCILRYYYSTRKVEFVAKAQSALNFIKKMKPLVIDDLLFWCDGYENVPFVDFNPPFELNLTRATGFTNPYDPTRLYYPGDLAGYNSKTYQWIYPTTATSAIPPTLTQYWKVVDRYAYSAITRDVIKRIKPCPETQPAALYDSEPTVARNLLRGNLFRFAVRYVYADQAKSTFGAWSDVPFPAGEEYINGNFVKDNTVNNVIKVSIDTAGDQVIACELAVRVGELGLWKMVYRLDKFDNDGNRLQSDNTSVVYNFYNDIAGLPLDQGDFNRLFDAVPQVTGYETIVESNRILDLDYTEGFNNLDIDMRLSLVNKPIPVSSARTIPGVMTYTFPQHVDCVLPAYIQPGTIVSAVLYRYTHLWDDPGNIPGYTDTTGADRFECDVVVGQGETTASVVVRLGHLINAKVASEYIDLTNGIPLQDMWYPTGNNDLYVRYNTILVYYPNHAASDRYYINLLTVYIIPVIQKTQSFKTGAWELFGMEYANDDMQLCTIQKNNESKLFVQTHTPGIQIIGQHYNQIKYALYHRPPMMAKKWRPVWGGSSLDYWLQMNVPFNKSTSGVSYAPVILLDNLHVKIPFNLSILDTKDTFSKFAIQNYQWKRGDRIKVYAIESPVAQGQFDYTPTDADFEILDVEFLQGDDAYLKDTSTPSSTNDNFIRDNNGNKVYDEGQSYIVVQAFQTSDYGLPAFSGKDTRQVIWEVYRPKANVGQNDVSLYMECDMWHDILDPHTANRRHEGGYDMGDSNQSINLGTPATGTFKFGDCYVKARVTPGAAFGCEAQQFSDYTDPEIDDHGTTFNVVSVGRENLYNPNAQRVNYFSNLLFGGKKIENTNVNELDKVLSSDSISLRQDFGFCAYAIEIGFTLKVVQRSKQTSFYVGREGLQQASAINPELISASQKVLSVPIVDEDEYGTIYGTSGVKHNRYYYIYDIYKGCIIRNSPNGSQEISALYDQNGKPHGIKDFLTSRSLAYINDGVENIDVVSAYDEQNDLVIFSFKDSVNPSLDMTLGFHEPSNMWVAFYNFNPDIYGYDGNTMVEFDVGKLWLMNDNPVRNNFSGKQYTSILNIISNKSALMFKRFISIFVTSNKVWSAPNAGDISIPPTGNNPDGMVSLLKKGAFTAEQGKYVADFGKNMVTNSSTPQVSDLVNGEDLQGEAMEIQLMNDDTTEVNIFAVQVNGVTSQISKNG